MELCTGKSRNHHVSIVHDEGWDNCPLCHTLYKHAEALEVLADAVEDQKLETAMYFDRIKELESEIETLRVD